MNHSRSYTGSGTYHFPKAEDMTFSKAYYLDGEERREIDQYFEHRGTLDIERGMAVNRIENIYVELDKGERFKIQTADQLSRYAKSAGVYEIFGDLDFDGVTWPSVFSTGTFKGQMFTSEGQTVTLSNINAKHVSTSAAYGGIFGRISKEARIADIRFEDAVFDIANTGARLRDTNFGLFAGLIEEGADISGVYVSGTMKLGALKMDTSSYSINLWANGSLTGITKGKIKLQVYGEKLINDYMFSVDPDSVIADEDGYVTLTIDTKRKDEQFYDIDIVEEA